MADLERAVAATPHALDVRFYYAAFLREHGRFADAHEQLAEILRTAPDHTETLVAYAGVSRALGQRTAARRALERALASAPSHPVALVNLANILALDEPDRAQTLYERALTDERAVAAAHRGLCSLASARGDRRAADAHRALGFPDGPATWLPYYGHSVAPVVLALSSTDGGNVPVDALLDAHAWRVCVWYVDVDDGRTLPPHGLVVNLIADADRAGPSLAAASRVGRRSRATIVNHPEVVAHTSRGDVARRLAGLDGVIAPAVRSLAEVRAFPCIVRVPGVHMGRGMERVADPHALAEVAHRYRRDDLLAIDYVETRSPDGFWRKYRALLVDGTLLPVHLAIAPAWKVHYFSSAMADEPVFRVEETRFLDDPYRAIGARAWDAVGRAARALGLDYAGVDFAPAPDGRVVVFEANAAMTMLAPDPDEHFAYRVAPYARIRAGIAAMIARRVAKERG